MEALPWQEVCHMEEKVRFMAALLAAEESMAELCERFVISRKPATSCANAIWLRVRRESRSARARRT